MGNRPIIEWCGPCWIEGGRGLSVAKRFKLPLCATCLEQFSGHEKEIKQVYAIWDAMPDFDTSPSAFMHFDNLVKAACSVPLHGPKQGCMTKEQDDKQQLVRGKKILHQIRKMLRDEHIARV